MTRRHLLGISLILVADLAGCGPSSPRPGTPTPHGGILVDLPEGKGFAEVLRQPAPGKAGRSMLVIYFLDPDRNAITPAPTAATIKGRTTGDKPVPLKPDASKAGALTSDPIADRGEIEAELSTTLGGSPVTVPILIR